MYLSHKDPCNSCLVVCTGHGWQERPRILRFSVIGVRKLSGCWMLVTAGKLATDVNSTMSILRFVEQHGRFHGHVDANSHFPGLCFVPQQRTQLARLAEGRLEMQILHQGCELFSASPIDYHRLSSFQNISGWCVHNFAKFQRFCHRIGWWENLQESPIFDGKNHGFL